MTPAIGHIVLQCPNHLQWPHFISHSLLCLHFPICIEIIMIRFRAEVIRRLRSESLVTVSCFGLILTDSNNCLPLLTSCIIMIGSMTRLITRRSCPNILRSVGINLFSSHFVFLHTFPTSLQTFQTLNTY